MVRPVPAAVTAETLAAADQAGTPVKTRTCHAGALISELPTNARAALLMAMTTTSVTNTSIVKVLQDHGLAARAENLARHRRRLTGGGFGCKCPLPDEATP